MFRAAMALYKIVSRLNGFALDVQGANTQPGSKVITYNSHGKDNQLWYDDQMTGTIRSKINGFCLDIEGMDTRGNICLAHICNF